MNNKFWNSLIEMVKSKSITIDRPKNSIHPRYPDYIYPFDYGYFNFTSSSDGDEIDCWIGSLGKETLSGIVVVLDPIKGDSEIKILLGCTDDDMKSILECHERGDMSGILIKKPE